MALGTGSTGSAAPAPTVARVSLNPANFVQGGLVDDVDVDVLNAKWCYYDYGGKSDSGEQLCLGMLIQETVPGSDGKLAQHEQYWSAGDKEFFRPSVEADGVPDGALLVPTGNRKQMSQSTNAAMLLGSLIASGFPVDRLESMGLTEALVGSRVHVNRVAQPKRASLIKKSRSGESAGAGEREQTTLVVTKIVALPGGKGVVQPAVQSSNAVPVASQPMVAAAATAATAPVPAANGALDELCGETLMNLLIAADGKLTKAQLPPLAFKALIAHPNKKEAVPRIYSDEFLSTCPGIKFDGATITLG